MTSPGGFLRELRRRRVYRAAIVYAAVAFVVWQVADIALPNLGLPQTAVTLVLALTVLGFPVALVLAWAYELRPEEPVAETSDAATGPPAGGAPARGGAETGNDRRARASIAVLPFDNMSTEVGSEYFADGISEELTHALGRMPTLRVAARTSSFALKGQRLDVREIGSRLSVAHVVEGSVRRGGDRLRVTAQLIDARDGYHVWSERFEREIDDVFAIQDDIVAAVVESLLAKLDPEGRGPPQIERTEVLDAYDLYLKARHALAHFDGSSVEEAVRYCSLAIELDPDFAPAHAALAEALTTQAIGFHSGGGRVLERARVAAERALSLAPDLPAAHLARGLSLLYHDWAFPQARAALEESVRINPSFVDGHRWLEFYWTYVEGDYERAIAALDRARELDPLDERVPIRTATVEYLLGDLAEAEAYFRKKVESDPDNTIAVIGLTDTLLRGGHAAEAAEIAHRLPISDDAPDVVLGVPGLVMGAGGDEAGARERLRALQKRAEHGRASPFWQGNVHVGLGELDQAFERFEEAFAAREGSMLYWAALPPSPGLQSDARFVSILRRMGLGHLLALIQARPVPAYRRGDDS